MSCVRLSMSVACDGRYCQCVICPELGIKRQRVKVYLQEHQAVKPVSGTISAHINLHLIPPRAWQQFFFSIYDIACIGFVRFSRKV